MFTHTSRSRDHRNITQQGRKSLTGQSETVTAIFQWLFILVAEWQLLHIMVITDTFGITSDLSVQYVLRTIEYLKTNLEQEM